MKDRVFAILKKNGKNAQNFSWFDYFFLLRYYILDKDIRTIFMVTYFYLKNISKIYLRKIFLNLRLF